MELQHDIPVEPNIGVLSMDRRQDVAVAGGLAFGAVLRLRLPAHSASTRPLDATTPAMRFEDSTLWIIATWRSETDHTLDV